MSGINKSAFVQIKYYTSSGRNYVFIISYLCRRSHTLQLSSSLFNSHPSSSHTFMLCCRSEPKVSNNLLVIKANCSPWNLFTVTMTGMRLTIVDENGCGIFWINNLLFVWSLDYKSKNNLSWWVRNPEGIPTRGF